MTFLGQLRILPARSGLAEREFGQRVPPGIPGLCLSKILYDYGRKTRVLFLSKLWTMDWDWPTFCLFWVTWTSS